MNTTTRSNPYIGPRSFRTGETLYGRDREVEELLDLLIAERIVVLYAPSGAGKTSLVQAALIPRLEEEGFRVLPPMRVNLEPPPNFARAPRFNRYIYSLILSVEEPLPDELELPLDVMAMLDLPAYLDRLLKPNGGRDDSHSGSVLIFDQFEEILTVNPTDVEAKAAFFAQVGQALRDRGRWALFSMREDYIAGLDRYLRPIPTRLSNTLRLDMLEESAARSAMQRPARQAGLDFTDAAARRLANDLRKVRIQGAGGSTEETLGPYVEPVQLQVVCYRLWDKLSAGARQIVEADVEAVGNVDSALSDYYAERVANAARETGVSERTMREWCEHQLITGQGIRGQVLQGPEQGLDSRAIQRLLDAYLVRAEKRRGATWFELAHDRLIEPVRKNNAEWREANLSPLQRQANLWEKQNQPEGLLLRGQSLVDAEAWAVAHAGEMTASELDFLEACRKARATEQRELEAARRIAEEQSRAARAAEQAAEAERKRAEEQTLAARRQRRLARITAGVAVVAILAAVVAGALGVIAQQQANLALSSRLETQAGALPATLLDRQLLLRALAYDIAPNTQVLDDIRASLEKTAVLRSFMRGHGGSINTLAFSSRADQVILASGGQDHTIRLWDFRLGTPIGDPLTGHTDQVRRIAFNPTNGNLLVSIGGDAQLILWNIETRQLVRQTQLDAPGVSLAFDWVGERLAVGRQDGSIELRDAASLELISAPSAAHAGPVLSLAFGVLGDKLYSGGQDSYIKMWDIAAGSLLNETRAAGEVVNLAVTGEYVVSGDENYGVELWNGNSLQLVQSAPVSPRGQPLYVGEIRDEYGNATLFYADDNNDLSGWDWQHNTISQPLLGYEGPIDSAAFAGSPNDVTYASSLGDTIFGWVVNPDQRKLPDLDLDPAQMRALACQSAGRNLSPEEWRAYMPDYAPYRQICEGLPAAR